VVDHLETGVDRITAVAKGEGGNAERSKLKETPANEAYFSVTIPSQNFDAFKSKLINKDSNIVSRTLGS